MAIRSGITRTLFAAVLVIASTTGIVTPQNRPPAAGPSLIPAEDLKFAVIGDNGTGEQPEYEVAAQLAKARAAFPFEIVIMLGDNMYGSQTPKDFVNKFERPYAPLLADGVTFYATLGNHDYPTNRSYPWFNMGGQRYYSFVRKNVRFFVLDTNLMDRAQLAWFETALKQSPEAWKICYFHHPIYSDGRTHGSDVELRVELEPLMVRYGIDAVFSGHDHIYERFKPQKGITYFVDGAAGSLRKGDLAPSANTAAGFDRDRTFMLIEIVGDEMTFRTISRTGVVVDSGVIPRRQLQ